MRKEIFAYTSGDGISAIQATRYMPEDGSCRAVVQIVHGMAEYVGRYEEFAQFLTDKGVVVTGEDHLGHGGSIGENGPGYFCEKDPATTVVEDVHTLRLLTGEKYPGVPYIILGHSMGSFILRNYLCVHGTEIDGAVVMGTGMQPKWLLGAARVLTGLMKIVAGEKSVRTFLDRIAFGAYNSRIKPLKTDKDWLSKDEERVARYIEDDLCGFVFTVNGFGTLFELIHRLQKPEYLRRIPSDMPILVVSGEEDPVGDYGAGVRLAVESMEAAGAQCVACKLYPGDRHEILNETDREQVMADIWDYLKDNFLSGE